jgi:hypothetical protein
VLTAPLNTYDGILAVGSDEVGFGGLKRICEIPPRISETPILVIKVVRAAIAVADSMSADPIVAAAVAAPYDIIAPIMMGMNGPVPPTTGTMSILSAL